MFRADLHCHSYFSDGSDSPEELIQHAINAGLSGLSITDHDTLDGYLRALDYAGEKQFPLLPGIEFSAAHKTEPVHILGYAFSFQNEGLHRLCARHLERRNQRNAAILRKLKGIGIEIDPSILERGESRIVGRPHIAHALIQKGVVCTMEEAFQKYLGEGKLAYVQGETISVEETIDVIHRAHGKAILAHPCLIKKRSTVKAMLEMPFDGLEGYYARMKKEAEWVAIAQKKGWLITGGSDYHGKTKPQSILGSSWVNQEVFSELFRHFTSVFSLS